MNVRTWLQRRLQTSVEGPAVAAITYYVVGLFGYLVKATQDSERMAIEPIVTAAFLPVAAFAIWWTFRSIRKKHVAGERS